MLYEVITSKKKYPDISDEEKAMLDNRLINDFQIPIEDELILVARSRNNFVQHTLYEVIRDIAFHYLDPFACAEIEQALEKRKDDREAFIATIKERITARLAHDFTNIPQIDGRVKSLYGIYKKVYMNGKDIDQIFDKYAIRVIVNTVNES